MHALHTLYNDGICGHEVYTLRVAAATEHKSPSHAPHAQRTHCCRASAWSRARVLAAAQMHETPAATESTEYVLQFVIYKIAHYIVMSTEDSIVKEMLVVDGMFDITLASWAKTKNISHEDHPLCLFFLFQDIPRQQMAVQALNNLIEYGTSMPSVLRGIRRTKSDAALAHILHTQFGAVNKLYELYDNPETAWLRYQQQPTVYAEEQREREKRGVSGPAVVLDVDQGLSSLLVRLNKR